MELFKIFGTIALKGQDKVEKDLDNTTSKASKMASVVGDKMKKAGTTMSNIGTKLLPVTTAISGIGIAAAKSSMDFEDAMAKVSTIADTTEVPIEDLKDAIVNLSDETGIASSEIAENVYNAISAGQSTGDAVAFVEKATRLAKAGFAESGDALDILTTIMNAYGLEADKVTDVSNMLIQTQNMGKTTVAELSASMGKIIPTAKGANVGLEQVTTSMAKLTANGIPTAEAATYLNSMLNELNKSGTKVSDTIKEKTGKSFSELMQDGYSLNDALAIVKEGAEDAGLSFSDLWSSSEAGKAASVINDTTNKLGDFNAAVGQMVDSTGATDEAFEKMNTNSSKIKITLNQFKNTCIDLGDTIMGMLAPYIEKCSDKVKELNDWFTNLDDGQKETIVTIGAVVAALAPCLIVFGKVTSGIGSLVSIVGKLSTAFASAEGGATGIGAALGGISAPVVAVVAVIGTLVAAFTNLWKTNEEFRNNITSTWEEVKSTFTDFVSGIKAELDYLGIDFAAIGAKIKEIWNGLCSFLAPIFEGTFKNISSIFKFVSNQILGAVKVFTGLIKGDWSHVFEGLKQIAKSGLDLVVNFFKTGYDTLNKLTGGKLGEMVDKVKEKITHIKDTVKEGIDKVKEFFDNLKLKLPDIKLPHFKLDGEFDLSKGKVPKIGVDWYAKGGILNKPTAFGINGNNLMVGGEAGAEAVAPIETLQKYVREAVSDQNNEVVSILLKILNALLEMDEGMGENMANAMTKVKFQANMREFGRMVRTVQ